MTLGRSSMWYAPKINVFIKLMFCVFQKVKAAKQFKRKDGDRFDNLVEQYKRKLMGNDNKTVNVKRNKWFDS